MLKPTPTVEVVVARYCEALLWLGETIPASWRVIVYDKSEGGPREKLEERWYRSPDGPDSAPAWPGSIARPNRGCEAETYLHHVAENYDRLADLSFFLQGEPFPHGMSSGMFCAALAEATGDVVRSGFGYLGTLTTCDSLGAPHHARPLHELREMFGAFFPGAPMPDRFQWFGGAQFAADREQLQAIPREAWARAAATCTTKLHACAMERLWFYLLGRNGR